MTIKEKKLVSAVIYLHNEEDRIAGFLQKIIGILDQNFQSFEIIVVNDCSTDNSIKNIKALKDLASSHISLVNMSLHQGLEVSMTAGIDLSMGDFVYEFDDLAIDYQESMILDVYYRIVEGFDIVSVAPVTHNALSSKLFYSLFNRYSKSKYKLRSERFRILSRRAINRAYSISKSIPYRKALYANSGLKMDVLEYKTIPRSYPRSNKEKGIFRNKMALNSLIIYTNLAFRISIGITIVLFCLTMFSGIYACAIYFSERPIEGWTTTILLISGSFSGLFFILAIIIKYLSLIVELIYSKKTYLVESVDKI